MRATLNITGQELMLLYLATGNADAGALILAAIKEEREFQIKNDLVHPQARKRRKRDAVRP